MVKRWPLKSPFTEEAVLQENHFCFYAFRKNNIWHKVFRTILLHMSFAFSWSGPDCRPYFCGKAVKGQEEGATLIVARRLNWTSWSSLTFHLHQYTAISLQIDSYASLLKNSFIDHSEVGAFLTLNVVIFILCYDHQMWDHPETIGKQLKKAVKPSQGQETCEHRSQTQIHPLITKTQPLASNIFVLSR